MSDKQSSPDRLRRPRPEPGVYYGIVFVPDRLAEVAWSADDVMDCQDCDFKTISIAALARHYTGAHGYGG